MKKPSAAMAVSAAQEGDRAMASPCYGCEERTETCHSTCERYEKFVLKKEAERKRRREESDYESARARQTEKVKSIMWRKYGRRK